MIKRTVDKDIINDHFQHSKSDKMAVLDEIMRKSEGERLLQNGETTGHQYFREENWFAAI